MPNLPLKYDPKKVIVSMGAGMLVLMLVVVIQSANLADQRKMTLAQSNYCIKYTSDIIANSSVGLLREQDAHKRSVDEANTKIEDLTNRYNKLLEMYKKKVSTYKADALNVYSFLIKSN